MEYSRKLRENARIVENLLECSRTATTYIITQKTFQKIRNIQCDYSHNPVQKSHFRKVLEGDGTKGRRWNVP